MAMLSPIATSFDTNGASMARSQALPVDFKLLYGTFFFDESGKHNRSVQAWSGNVKETPRSGIGNLAPTSTEDQIEIAIVRDDDSGQQASTQIQIALRYQGRRRGYSICPFRKAGF